MRARLTLQHPEKLLNAGSGLGFCPDAGHPVPNNLAKLSVIRLNSCCLRLCCAMLRASLVTEAVPGSGEMSFSASVGFQARIKLAHFGLDGYVIGYVPRKVPYPHPKKGYNIS